MGLRILRFDAKNNGRMLSGKEEDLKLLINNPKWRRQHVEKQLQAIEFSEIKI